MPDAETEEPPIDLEANLDEIQETLRLIVYLITGQNADIDRRLRGKYGVIKIVPKTQMNHVIGRGGKTVDALKGLVARMGRHHGIENIDLLVKDPPESDEPEGYPAFQIKLEDVESNIELILKMADYRSSVIGMESGSTTTISIGVNIIHGDMLRHEINADLKEVIDACINGMTRNDPDRSYELTTS